MITGKNMQKLTKIMEYMMGMDIERRNKWIKNSHKLRVVIDEIEVPFQGLANIDAKLVIEDMKIINGKPSSPYGDITEHMTRSYLWVLGSYEIIRTLSQFADAGNSNKFEGMKEDIRLLKHEFEKLRVPLAKFEAARRNPNGYPFAYPVIDKDLGVSWLIGQNDHVPRKYLSDKMLALVESLP